MKSSILFLLSLLALVLAGCRTPPSPAPAQAAAQSSGLTGLWNEPTTLLDEQGAVSVEITPLNLNNPEMTLDFQVNLNTHSVDLTMDLATLATLSTDTGKTVQAVHWDAPSGGHHLEGVLSFPLKLDSSSLLEGASSLTITILDLDAPERTFTWK